VHTFIELIRELMAHLLMMVFVRLSVCSTVELYY